MKSITNNKSKDCYSVHDELNDRIFLNSKPKFNIMKEIHVLGVGPGIEDYDEYRKDENPIAKTIGVNDIFKYVETDILLLMDTTESFKDRINIIRNSKPLITYSSLVEWHFMPGFIKFSLCNTAGSIKDIDNNKNILPFHVDTTFTAACLAYRMKAKKIVLYGAHFYGHHLMAYKTNILSAYQNLYNFLLSKEVELFVYYNSSLLAEVLPFLKHDFNTSRNDNYKKALLKTFTPKTLDTKTEALNKKEKDKYQEIWQKHNDYSSPNCIEFAKYIILPIHGIINEGRCLDLGCGNGNTVQWLLNHFIDAYGIDITLLGVKKRVGDDYFNNKLKVRFCESPIWAMPYGDNLFHYTFSTDFLEHIPPEKVEESIKEIIRVTRVKTIHCIATFPGNEYFGHKTHLTIKPLAWWLKLFEKHNSKGLKLELLGWNELKLKSIESIKKS